MPLLEEPTNSLHVNSAPISSLIDFPEKYSQRLQRAGFTTVSEIILISPESIKSQTGLSVAEVQDVYRRLSAICSPLISTITERRSASRKEEEKDGFITLGSPDLDKLFGSQQSETVGIPTGLLTEIVGESGSGKTCLSLQLSLNVQLPFHLGGLNGACVYLCTESGFPTSRLFEMAVALSNRFNAQDTIGLNVESLMENVHLTRVLDPDSLLSMVHYSLPIFLDRHNNPTITSEGQQSTRRIRLIVLDSIGAIFRADLSSTSATTTTTMGKIENNSNHKFRMTERAASINQVADGLKILADKYKLAVVVVNQVSDVITHQSIAPIDNNQRTTISSNTSSSSSLSGHPRSTPASSNPTSQNIVDSQILPLIYNEQSVHFNGQKVTSNRKEAALGIHWTNSINIRIMINKLNNSYIPVNHLSSSTSTISPNQSEGGGLIKYSDLGVRQAVVVFSPFCKTSPDLDPVKFVIHSTGIVSVNQFINS
ncbi:hypothetical protein MJO28_008624 [Puccinia striiformis f. sp. tritici]|uniref:Uncharacterized protein n=1 Tax=Puccinia striiformis f. sp. tritici TaxID=168172 RepID=A0ACC0ECB4_9BASI|nr:hypothetical protein Pst134EA_015314 [Puccinia striiformis f. sp. tritici]KAH9463229.1 hypothetical protein Pst134EA_015314 [Puccinia striiformis f. sp. tritici]KAI7949803.1 hypothetical protein MJO28_008624 [Puccinia striiformis f. sp. tritici]KAI9602952.1 hypothetical protein H4Q26_002260 [Puccinia striiformis f. sp. tritici PST-130]